MLCYAKSLNNYYYATIITLYLLIIDKACVKIYRNVKTGKLLYKIYTC